MFGFGDPKKKAVKELTQNLSVLLGPYERFGALLPGVTSDPYVAGYVTGRIVWFVIGLTKNRLSKSDAMATTGLILINLFGDGAADVSRCLKVHEAQNSEAYQLGMARAQKLALYFFRIDNVVGDAEYGAALAWTAAIRKGAIGFVPVPKPDAFVDAIGGLEGLWFNDYMNKLCEAHDLS